TRLLQYYDSHGYIIQSQENRDKNVGNTLSLFASLIILGHNLFRQSHDSLLKPMPSRTLSLVFSTTALEGYTIFVLATSGTISHSLSISLTVQQYRYSSHEA